VKIFSGSSNKPLAQNSAKELGVKVSPLEISVFPDGERRIRVVDSVVDEKTVVFQSTSTPPDQNYMELFFMVDALKRNGASVVTAVIPYLGYERQDHVFRDGEAVSLEVIAETLQRVGVDKLVAFDLHSIKVPELFTIPVLHLTALDLFAQKIKELFPSDRNRQSLVLVSPDMGGIRRIKMLSESLGNISFATVEKNRDLETGDISDSSMEGDVSGKTAIIVDDMISTGRTIVAAEKILLENGAEKVLVFATHAVFSENAEELLQNLRAERVFVTDTIFIPEEKYFSKLEIISVCKTIAEGLKHF
jgi:ribose-phosphate pyrophosphokinase